MNLNWWDSFKARIEQLEQMVSGEAQQFMGLIKKLGEECGENQICQELATDAVNEGVKVEDGIVSSWLANKKYGEWCAGNKICNEIVNEGLQKATAAEKAAVAHWLHPDAMIIML